MQHKLLATPVTQGGFNRGKWEVPGSVHRVGHLPACAAQAFLERKGDLFRANAAVCNGHGDGKMAAQHQSSENAGVGDLRGVPTPANLTVILERP